MELILIWAFTIGVTASLFTPKPVPVVDNREMETKVLNMDKR